MKIVQKKRKKKNRDKSLKSKQKEENRKKKKRKIRQKRKENIAYLKKVNAVQFHMLFLLMWGVNLVEGVLKQGFGFRDMDFQRFLETL